MSTTVQAGSQTYFAPPGRLTAEALAQQVAELIAHPVVHAILESFCGQAVILNQQRQILAASPEFVEALAECGIHESIGMRPGEAFGCRNADAGPDGCGTSRACGHCGAVLAVLAAQCSSQPAYEECWISMRRNGKAETIEFKAKATPMELAGHPVVVLAMQDISDNKRRAILERTFLHDVRNLLGGILSWSESLELGDEREAMASLRTLTLQMRDLVAEHALLAQAERGELVVSKEPIDLQHLAVALQAAFGRHPSGQGKNLLVRFPVHLPAPVTDRPVVLRILINMVTNALEASRPGSTVEVCYQITDGGAPMFTVRNPGVIASEVADRVFQRSFTTKTTPGHGLGTYSMRLFAESYLGGHVGFSTSEEEGTVFWLALPPAAQGPATAR